LGEGLFSIIPNQLYLACSLQSFDTSFPPHGTGSIQLFLGIYQSHRAAGRRVTCPVPGIVLSLTAQGISRPAGVKGAVGTFKNVAKVRHLSL